MGLARKVALEILDPIYHIPNDCIGVVAGPRDFVQSIED